MGRREIRDSFASRVLEGVEILGEGEYMAPTMSARLSTSSVSMVATAVCRVKRTSSVTNIAYRVVICLTASFRAPACAGAWIVVGGRNVCGKASDALWAGVASRRRARLCGKKARMERSVLTAAKPPRKPVARRINVI